MGLRLTMVNCASNNGPSGRGDMRSTKRRNDGATREILDSAQPGSHRGRSAVAGPDPAVGDANCRAGLGHLLRRNEAIRLTPGDVEELVDLRSSPEPVRNNCRSREKTSRGDRQGLR
jgi:hypothetical protein